MATSVGILQLFPEMCSIDFPVLSIGGELSSHAGKYLQTHPAVSAVISVEHGRKQLAEAGMINISEHIITQWILQQLHALKGKASTYVVVIGLEDPSFEITCLPNFKGIITTTRDDLSSVLKYPRLHCRNIRSLQQQLDLMVSPASFM